MDKTLDDFIRVPMVYPQLPGNDYLLVDMQWHARRAVEMAIRRASEVCHQYSYAMGDDLAQRGIGADHCAAAILKLLD
jgi:hypothetical protein